MYLSTLKGLMNFSSSVTDRHVAGGHVGGAAPLTLHSRIAN